MATRPRFLTDNHISDKVVDYLRAEGYTVELSREALGEKAPDPAIVVYANRTYATVITKNYLHFNQEAYRARDGNREEHRHWGLLCIRCGEPHIIPRFRQLQEIFLGEYHRSSVERYPRALLVHMEIYERSYMVHF